MAKVRRVIRKLEHVRRFDDQIWPVYAALILFGGFLSGVVLAYLRFDDPRWYANAVTGLMVVPLLIGLLIGGLYFIDHRRRITRPMQLAIVLSLLVNVMLVVVMDREVFSRAWDTLVYEHPNEQREPVVIPEYTPQRIQNPQQQQQDFNRPLEVETPDIVPETIERQETPVEETPTEPQPIPVPDSQPTEKPNITRREKPEESTPRQSEQQSKLSRQKQNTRPQPTRPVTVPSPTQRTQQANNVQASDSQLTQQANRAETQRRQVDQPPSVTKSQPTTQLTRRTTQRAPQPSTTASPTLERQVARPAVTPRTQATASATPSTTQRTTETPLQPANTKTQQQVTTAPQVTRAESQTTTTSPTVVQRQTTERRSEAEVRPSVAQTPTPVANQRTRTTVRPDVSTTASNVTAQAPKTPQNVQLQAQANPVQRQTNATPTTRSDSPTQPTPTPTAQNTATVSRRATQTAPSVATAAPRPTRSVARNVQQARPTPSQVAATQPRSPSRQSQPAEVSPTSVATSRRQTPAPQAAPSVATPTSQVSSQPTAQATARTSTRKAPSPTTPNEAANTSQVARRTPTPSQQTPNVKTNVAQVTTNMAPQQAANAQPRPSTATVARQQSTSPTATRSQPSMTKSAASTTNQVARAVSRRASTATVPTTNPNVAATATPSRATRQAAQPSSPVAVASPAVAQSPASTNQPTASPAAMSLTRARAGVTGAGESRNLDSANPAANSPASVASGSAQRAKATQNTPQGTAFSPSAPAVVARSRAQAERPSSTLQAQPVEVATASGSQQPAALNADATAAIARANADATPGPTTAEAGTVQVDLGPTRVVSGGASGRAAGGGQPQVNPEAQSRHVVRDTAGGAPAVSLQVEEVTELAAAPAGDGGGMPESNMADPSALAVQRTESGGPESVSGGPSTADETGPASEVSTAELLANNQRSRADESAPSAAGGDAPGGDDELEDEEEKARRLARQAVGGAPQVAMAAPATGAAPASPQAAGESGGPASELIASTDASSLQRADVDSGTASGGAPAASSAPAEQAAAGQGQVAAMNTRRAESSDAAAGAPVPGGGTASPRRASQGPAFAASTQAATVAVAGAPESGGEAKGVPLEATGVAANRDAGGLVAPAQDGPAGAIAGDIAMSAPNTGQAGSAAGKRQAGPSAELSEEGFSAADLGAPFQRAQSTNLPGTSGVATVVAVPQPGPSDAGTPSVNDLAGDLEIGPMARQAAGALAVNIESVDGPGGLASELQTDVGLTSRQASPDSPEIQVREVRFLKQDVAGLPSVSTSVVAAKSSFQPRTSRVPGNTGQGDAGPLGPETEEAIERGLKFLAGIQRTDGRWTLANVGEDVALRSDTAATGLCLLAFQGAGYNHRQFKYQEPLLRAVNFLVKNQQESGDLFVTEDDISNQAVRLYSHGIATIALCEAYGMTQDPDLREPAQRAIDFIVAAQHETRGGWRYTPGVSSDTSVTGWMMMALKSGDLAGLKVPETTYQKIDNWLDLSQGSDGERYLYRYNPYAPDTAEQRHGRVASKTMTSVGLLMRLYSGWKRDADELQAGAEYLLDHLPANGTLRNPQRDTYYWYYATQFMFHMKGDYWKKWNAALHPTLVDTQVMDGELAGSWHPRTPVPDRWAAHGGRLYVTTLNLLSLEVHYRHLPLYDDTAK
ncbi:MAG: hypothetical protein CL681_27720 [Blastopirellula sp.]|nr:hypothetical protein [Blastopirellula sp.]